MNDTAADAADDDDDEAVTSVLGNLPPCTAVIEKKEERPRCLAKEN